MKMFKYLLVSVIALILTARADTTTYPLSTTLGTSSLLQAGGKINQITLANAAAAAVTIKLYDAPTNVLTYVVAAYTNVIRSSSSVITTYTNILGRVESRTNTVLGITYAPTSAVTNNYRLIYTGVVPASSTLSFVPTSPLSYGLGLALNNSATNVAATIDYSPSR